MCQQRNKALGFTRRRIAFVTRRENETFWPLSIPEKDTRRLVVFRFCRSLTGAETAPRMDRKEALSALPFSPILLLQTSAQANIRLNLGSNATVSGGASTLTIL